MQKKQNKGFSLIELIIAIAIMAVAVAFIAPSYLSTLREARYDKDETKFESMCYAFKTALAEPEVKKEMESLAGENNFTILMTIAADGTIIFEEGEVAALRVTQLKNTTLWLNTYQSIGMTYTTESSELRGKFLRFTLTPDKYDTVAKCEYEIIDER